eukprot:CAMPEP_0182927598 /NCGR_PEP_ID=MMETSP0105_2-20130417/13870_1 /TAXON_ID=81532 ORGANISM="Acanthoeca-like sp., Strain 10tr" /NCGR_SAMPLE_ID=MMETSP0105_2 /ASSEMBLY_ACC=CAM_ASM_000205 /LENGTH=248 /DNA_ID=CAMNT_0025065553 /DNA_START=131 /DNA_END=877 /DNA_ORIENTATION=-
MSTVRPAPTTTAVRNWQSQERPVITPHSQRTKADKAAANEAHKQSHDTLRALQRASGGCADCSARLSGWAALPHGAFVCINCAQIHRGIGRHISQVKSVNSGTYTWFPDEIAMMQYGGNSRVQAEFCASADALAKPDQNAPVHEKEKYIRLKYEQRKWYVAGGRTIPSHSPPSRARGPRRASARALADVTVIATASLPPTAKLIDIPSVGELTLQSCGYTALSPPTVMPVVTAACGGDEADFFAEWGL